MTTTRCTEDHFLNAGCLDCIARVLATKNLATVELWWEHGVISKDVRDGYRHVWALSAPRSAAYDHWMAYPDTAEARAFAAALGQVLPSGRAYC